VLNVPQSPCIPERRASSRVSNLASVLPNGVGVRPEFEPQTLLQLSRAWLVRTYCVRSKAPFSKTVSAKGHCYTHSSGLWTTPGRSANFNLMSEMDIPRTAEHTNIAAAAITP
jgi:hypothetical protein